MLFRSYAVAGGGYRVMHRLVRGRFERREARAFRYCDGSASRIA